MATEDTNQEQGGEQGGEQDPQGELSLPMFAVIGNLPVRAYEDEDGDNVEVEAWDPGSKKMKRAPQYLPQMLLGQDGDGPVDIEILPEGEWTARVKELTNNEEGTQTPGRGEQGARR